MKAKRMLIVGIVAASVAAAGGVAMSAQDKSTLQVPNGLAFSEFVGYEGWEVVSVSYTDTVIDVIVANPAMIDAYKAGIPDNGQPFPDGAKMAKIHWNKKKSA